MNAQLAQCLIFVLALGMHLKVVDPKVARAGNECDAVENAVRRVEAALELGMDRAQVAEALSRLDVESSYYSRHEIIYFRGTGWGSRNPDVSGQQIGTIRKVAMHSLGHSGVSVEVDFDMSDRASAIRVKQVHVAP